MNLRQYKKRKAMKSSNQNFLRSQILLTQASKLIEDSNELLLPILLRLDPPHKQALSDIMKLSRIPKEKIRDMINRIDDLEYDLGND